MKVWWIDDWYNKYNIINNIINKKIKYIYIQHNNIEYLVIIKYIEKMMSIIKE